MTDSRQFLLELYDIIERRAAADPAESYTARLLAGGREAILAKVEEEAGEVLVAARSEGRARLVEEAADLVYHLYVLLLHEGVTLDDLGNELAARHARRASGR